MTQASNLRRVRREDSPIVERRTDGLEACLELWITWMGKTDKDLGAQRLKLPTRSTEDADYEADFTAGDGAQQRRDDEIAMATNAMIESLPRFQRWAIHRKCSITTVWNFPQLDYIGTAVDACVELEKKLRGNVATRMVFL